ncbi:unnamed protein product [Arabidopsis thaliana]|uniref:Uncharacterized protein n=1 Tax=Arabidopsis thaliana TaxID=3702 RepID=A0A5S9YAG3_ARATH|nr:unnamed protein product [Arabidopsis thaliana]
MELIQGAIRFIQMEKARTDLESDIKEYERNLLLLDQTYEDDFSEEEERFKLEPNLKDKKERLAALPTSSFYPSTSQNSAKLITYLPCDKFDYFS